jgi:hypothetical protein
MPPTAQSTAMAKRAVEAEEKPVWCVAGSLNYNPRLSLGKALKAYAAVVFGATSRRSRMLRCPT